MVDPGDLQTGDRLLQDFHDRILAFLQQTDDSSDHFLNARRELVYADTSDAQLFAGVSVRNIGKKKNFVFIDPAAGERNPRIEIRFFAANCAVYIGPQCEVNGLIRVHADNTLTWLSGSNGQPSAFNITHWSRGTVVYIAPRATSNGAQIVTMGEGTGVFMAEDCMLSTGIWLKTSDMHAIVDLATGQPINRHGNKGDIMLGKHVWVGQDVLITHDVQVGRGAILGAKSFVNKNVGARTLNVGIPAREIRTNVSWLRSHVVVDEELQAVRELIRD